MAMVDLEKTVCDWAEGIWFTLHIC